MDDWFNFREYNTANTGEYSVEAQEQVKKKTQEKNRRRAQNTRKMRTAATTQSLG